MKKPYIVASMNALLIPISVYCGIQLDHGSPWAIIPLSICMGIEAACTLLWFRINRELMEK
jgi:hypothetical protein